MQVRRFVTDLVGRYQTASARELNVGRVMLQMAAARDAGMAWGCLRSSPFSARRC
jgi:hypothetical protein